MLTREQLLSTPPMLPDKARGAMLGIAVGTFLALDAPASGIQREYSPVFDRSAEENAGASVVEFSLLTARTLLDCDGVLTHEAVGDAWMEYVATTDETYGRQTGEYEAARNLRRGLRPPMTGRANAYAHSATAAARVAPIGILCAGDPQAAMKMAAIDASVSHDREGVWGAQSVAAGVAVAMADGSAEEIVQAMFEPAPQDSWLHYALYEAYNIVGRSRGRLTEAWPLLHEVLWSGFPSAVCAVVPQAVGLLLLLNKDFQNAVSTIAGFGRNAEYITPICGAVLGARYGASAIPEQWRRAVRHAEGSCLDFTRRMNIEETADALALLARPEALRRSV